jgi:HNH endonuclease
MRMEIEHFIPLALGGQTVEENLWLSCRRCNGFKGSLIRAIDPETQESVPLFNPRQESWHEHFVWSEDGSEIIGLTPTGRATVIALNLNDPIAVTARKLWVSVGWWPPSD